MLLVFSTSLVGKFVYNCLEQFLFLGPFGSIWSFLWPSSLVLVLLVSICSFLALVCREWRWISWTRNHVFHRCLAFSSSLRAFYINVCWWSLTEVEVRGILLKSLGLISVFWPISIMQVFGWCPIVILFIIPSATFFNPLVTVPRAPITIRIHVTFMFHWVFFQFPCKVEVFIHFSLSLTSTLW